MKSQKLIELFCKTGFLPVKKDMDGNVRMHFFGPMFLFVNAIRVGAFIAYVYFGVLDLFAEGMEMNMNDMLILMARLVGLMSGMGNALIAGFTAKRLGPNTFTGTSEMSWKAWFLIVFLNAQFASGTIILQTPLYSKAEINIFKHFKNKLILSQFTEYKKFSFCHKSIN